MPLDPLIAGGFRGIELQNPLEAYGRVAQLQHLQQQNELARMQMQQAQREADVQNRLLALDPKAADYIAQVTQLSPKMGAELELRAVQRSTAERQAEQAKAQTLETRQKVWQSQARDAAVNPSDTVLQQLAKAAVDNGLTDMNTATEQYQQLVKLPMDQRSAMLARYGAPAVQPVKTEATQLAKLLAERDALPLNDPRRKAYDDAIVKASTHQQPQNVNVKVASFVPASEEAQKEYIRDTSKERTALRNAPDTLINVDKARALIPGAKGFMGAGGEPMLKAASFLNNRLGFGIDVKGVADATELRTRLFEGIMDNLKRLDSQPSQEQQRIMQEALGTLGTDPNALPRVLDKIEETVRARVSRFNEDVTDAEARGVKFPYKPQIKLPTLGANVGAIPTARTTPPPATTAPTTAPAAAPMYARNPSTGQRIMSTDGGNTWNPVR